MSGHLSNSNGFGGHAPTPLSGFPPYPPNHVATSMPSQVATPSHISADTVSHNGSTPGGINIKHEETPSPSGPIGKPKQKRNKPTLSCEECVERKTKASSYSCDRGRPACVACIKRQSECHYTHVANMIANADRKNGVGAKTRYVTKPQHKSRKFSNTSNAALVSPSSESGTGRHLPPTPGKPTSSTSSSPYMLSHMPFAKSTPSNIFGIGTHHPFANYWTCSGGMPEVIGVLPSKDQADILIAKFFEAVDPVYPFLHRRTFYAEYERFWASSPAEKAGADASLVALHCTLYALGTQFMPFPSYEERTASAEFYASAANQALRLFSYLNKSSLYAIGTGVLLSYFLMNDNHASDAYAWSGIHLRQAYALRLHRDPDVVVPSASPVEKQLRRKLWQAVFFQDTFLTVLLKLPPTANHSDVPIDSLIDETQWNSNGMDVCPNSQSRVENLMSISVIAPPQDPTPPLPVQPHHNLDPTVDKSDVEYIRSMWKLGDLVQDNLSSPMSLSMPLATSARHKTSLVSSFRSLYRTFPSSLITLDYAVLQQQAASNPRAARQNLFLTSNYFHCLMILQISENEEAGVICNIHGGLEAAHEAIWAFFKLFAFFEAEAGVWWVFQHRAFEEALTITNLLAALPPDVSTNDPLYAKCKDDVQRMIEILERDRGSREMQKTRLLTLRSAFERVAA